jgi:hypothetical protein
MTCSSGPGYLIRNRNYGDARIAEWYLILEEIGNGFETA